jgi:hypothetical protein
MWFCALSGVICWLSVAATSDVQKNCAKSARLARCAALSGVYRTFMLGV